MPEQRFFAKDKNLPKIFINAKLISRIDLSAKDYLSDEEKERVWMVYIQAWDNPKFRQEFAHDAKQAIDNHQQDFGFSSANLSQIALDALTSVTPEELETVAKFRQKMKEKDAWVPEPAKYY